MWGRGWLCVGWVVLFCSSRGRVPLFPWSRLVRPAFFFCSFRGRPPPPFGGRGRGCSRPLRGFSLGFGCFPFSVFSGCFSLALCRRFCYSRWCVVCVSCGVWGFCRVLRSSRLLGRCARLCRSPLSSWCPLRLGVCFRLFLPPVSCFRSPWPSPVRPRSSRRRLSWRRCRFVLIGLGASAPSLWGFCRVCRLSRPPVFRRRCLPRLWRSLPRCRPRVLRAGPLVVPPPVPLRSRPVRVRPVGGRPPVRRRLPSPLSPLSVVRCLFAPRSLNDHWRIKR